MVCAWLISGDIGNAVAGLIVFAATVGFKFDHRVTKFHAHKSVTVEMRNACVMHDRFRPYDDSQIAVMIDCDCIRESAVTFFTRSVQKMFPVFCALLFD